MTDKFFERRMDTLIGQGRQRSKPQIDKLARLLGRLEKIYEDYLNKKYPDGKVFGIYQDAQAHEGIDITLPASAIIRKAYPVLQYDEDGQPIDNREQAYIATVTAFTAYLEEKNPSDYCEVDADIYYATSIFAASSGLLETSRRLHQAVREKEEPELINHLVDTCHSYSRQLITSLSASSPALTRELQLKESWSVRFMTKLRNFMSTLLHPFQRGPVEQENREEEIKPVLHPDMGCYLGDSHSILYSSPAHTPQVH